jgi:type IV secretory pathway ATPase VirB11/archaellum biosynthesis ATPase
LEILKNLAEFIDSLQILADIKINNNTQKCEQCTLHRYNELQEVIKLSNQNPFQALLRLRETLKTKEYSGSECDKCREKYHQLISKIVTKANLNNPLSKTDIDSNYFYKNYIRPYVRPGFVDSYIQLEPPLDAVFLESYQIQKKDRRPTAISIYTLKSRPEKLYFVVPPEYELPREELYLLEKVRCHLSHHRPKDASFMDADTAREYFQRLGKQVISNLVKESNSDISADRIEYLADIFSRYTAGFGILEDLLLDPRIQDIYVNAPVTHNPLHLVVEGEEYTSNVYLSVGDIDSLASRFRSISGRAFSEASPVLDMDLGQFHTRVAALSNPLTPHGIALALRKHRQKPWTLAHFVENHMMSPLAAGFLSFLVDGQASLLIGGSRGAGKTSLLSALLLEIPQRFRILTIEDTAEIPVDILQTQGYKIQSLITKSISSGSESAEVDPSTALRTALRLGESVLIIGEVRGVEAKVLFEAMRVGAAGNLIMGTIHGSTTRDIYERLVFDIGIPSTSFKAVDAVIIAAPIRSEGGIERTRRITQISEITKKRWTANPDPDRVFHDIMIYNTEKDELIPTELLSMGQSEVMETIAKKWGVSIEKTLQNIQLRTDIKKTIVEYSQHNQELLESPSVRDANNALWMFIEQSKAERGHVDYDHVRNNWMNWFHQYTGRKKT